MSSDFGAVLLRGLDQQVGVSAALAGSFKDSRHASYIQHELRDLFAQRIYQIACSYEDCNDANALRSDPMFKLALDRAPLDQDNDLASAPTFSRLENAATTKDLYRMAQTFVDLFIASYAHTPQVIVLDMDHSDDRTHGQQELSFYNNHYGSHCYLPLFVFEGLSGKFVSAALRTGKRPSGAENAMIMRRVLKRLRAAWPDTHIVLRGDSHFANPELMQLAIDIPHCDFVFGLSTNSRLAPLAEPALTTTRAAHEHRCGLARANGQPEPQSTRAFFDLEYGARSWPQAFRVILKAEVMGLGDNPRFVVTSIHNGQSNTIYCDLYCARGQDENYIKMMKNDLAADRTSDHRFLANHMRLFFACGAYVLHQALRDELLCHTELANAQPSTVIMKLFKIAVKVIQYKDRVKLQLPTACPFGALLHRITEVLYALPTPAYNST